VQHKPLVPYSELPRVFAEADFLYLPYDFSKESIKFIKYSMPTKAPEYMMSGTPVIILGPAETALVKDAQRGNWAKVITENSVDALAAAIKTLIEDESLRKQITGNAIRIAETNYNAVKIRNEFKEVITSIVQ
jgi:glycosyltransferase involved in cell wall biosynthesis